MILGNLEVCKDLRKLRAHYREIILIHQTFGQVLGLVGAKVFAINHLNIDKYTTVSACHDGFFQKYIILYIKEKL